MLKRKLAVFHCLFIILPLKISHKQGYKHPNILPTEFKEVFTNAMHCLKQFKNVKQKTSFSNSKNSKLVKKILGAYSPPPPSPRTPSCVLLLMLTLWETQSSIQKMAKAMLCYPQDIEKLGWCSARPALPHAEKVPL